jgi:predicted dehydrogenase
MKFAVVGCQHFHINAFIDEMRQLGHEFAGVFEWGNRNLEENPWYEEFFAQACARKYEVPLFQTEDELLSQGIGLIGCAARNDEKIEVIEWAEAHGIHVMADKPAVIDYQGLQRLQRVAARDKIKVGMMLTGRFSPNQYTLKQLIDNDVLGEIYDFTFLKPHKLNPMERPKWFFDKKINGGLIIDIMIHDVDMLGWLLDREMTGIHAALVKNILPEHPDFYNNAIVNLLFDRGMTATLKADWLMPEAFDLWGDGRIFVSGSKGRAEIRIAGDVLGAPGPYITQATHTEKTVRVEAARPPVNLSQDFINRTQGKPHLITAQQIHDCHAAVLRIDAAGTKYISGHDA